jgi:hypothetical protein
LVCGACSEHRPVPGGGGQSSIARLAGQFNHLGTLLKSATLSGPSLASYHGSPSAAAITASPDALGTATASSATLSRIAAPAAGAESAPGGLAGGNSGAGSTAEGQTHDIRVCLYCLERSDVPVQERYTPLARKALYQRCVLCVSEQVL